MSEFKVSTQAELDAILSHGVKPGDLIAIVGDGSQVVVIDGRPGRAGASVEAWESSRVVARGSSRVEAWESSSVEAWESSSVVAGAFVAVQKQPDHDGKIKGGVVIRVKRPTTVREWCAFYGVTVQQGDVAILYKGVRDDYRTGRDFLYAPGTTPEAPDWDGDARECGGGLHFSPSPAMTLEFYPEATRFLACPVRLRDIRKPKKDDTYPQKVKARRIALPIVEVDLFGDPVKK